MSPEIRLSVVRAKKKIICEILLKIKGEGHEGRQLGGGGRGQGHTLRVRARQGKKDRGK